MADQRGFIFSSLALLLIFSIMLLVSGFVTSFKEGSEGAVIKVLGRKVAFVGEDMAYNIWRLELAGMTVDNRMLAFLENLYREYAGVEIEMWRIENEVWIEVWKSWAFYREVVEVAG